MQADSARSLHETIQSERHYGEVYLVVEDSSKDASLSIPERITVFMRRCGLNDIGDRWREVGRGFAERTLEWVLSRDLAYSARLMSTSRAKTLTDEFLGLFEDDAKFFTNYISTCGEDTVLDGLTSHVSDSVTDATFDIGILVVGSTHVGILWVADED